MASLLTNASNINDSNVSDAVALMSWSRISSS